MIILSNRNENRRRIPVCLLLALVSSHRHIDHTVGQKSATKPKIRYHRPLTQDIAIKIRNETVTPIGTREYDKNTKRNNHQNHDW